MTDRAYVASLQAEQLANEQAVYQLRQFVATLAPLDSPDDGNRAYIYSLALCRMLDRNAHLDQLAGAIMASVAMREE